MAAWDNFNKALKDHPDAFNILLVDSEGSVSPRRPAWQHLRDRNKWPLRADLDDQCHLMAQTVEAWMVADPNGLKAAYGRGFAPKQLPQAKDVETIDKADLLAALKQATRNTLSGEYHKINHFRKIMTKLKPENVRLRAAHCDRFFKKIENKIKKSKTIEKKSKTIEEKIEEQPA